MQSLVSFNKSLDKRTLEITAEGHSRGKYRCVRGNSPRSSSHADYQSAIQSRIRVSPKKFPALLDEAHEAIRREHARPRLVDY